MPCNLAYKSRLCVQKRLQRLEFFVQGPDWWRDYNLVQTKVFSLLCVMTLYQSFAFRSDLEAALIAEPGNPEATALLHHRSVAVEKARV